MGISAQLSGGTSAGGSSNQSTSYSQGSSFSETDAAAARAWSAKEAQKAREWQEKMFEREMEYNAKEAQKNRDFQQAQVDVANQMANTVYTRSAKNMKEAGINPILAYSAGIGGAGAGSVTSGTAGSASAPSGFMGQSFMDQHSASTSYSEGQSSGSSWEHSESGLATALQQMGDLITQTIDTMKSGRDIDTLLNGLQNNAKNLGNDIWNGITSKMPEKVRDFLGIKEKYSGVQRKTPTTSSTKKTGGTHIGGGRNF